MTLPPHTREDDGEQRLGAISPPIPNRAKPATTRTTVSATRTRNARTWLRSSLRVTSRNAAISGTNRARSTFLDFAKDSDLLRFRNGNAPRSHLPVLQFEDKYRETRGAYVGSGADANTPNLGPANPICPQRVPDTDGLPGNDQGKSFETPNPRSLPFYERQGFEVTGKAQAGVCPPITFMLRAAR